MPKPVTSLTAVSLHGVSGRQQERAIEEYHPDTRYRMWLHSMLPMHLTAFITCFKGGK